MLAMAWKANNVPPRVKSNGNRPWANGTTESGLSAVFGSYPAFAHWFGSVRAGFGMEFPLESMQGELNPESVMPKPKFSSRRVCFKSTPYFKLLRPDVAETSTL